MNIHIFPEIGFFKFLSNCQQDSFKSHLERWTDSLMKWHQTTGKSNVLSKDNFVLNKNTYEEYEEYINIIYDTIKMYLDEGSFSIQVKPTQIPHICGGFDAPGYMVPFNNIENKAFFEKWNHFLINGLQTEMIDFILYGDYPDEKSTFGRRKWIYFFEKMWKIESLLLAYKTSCQDEFSIYFKFVEQTLSSVELMGEITRLAPDNKRNVKKFLKEHDKFLLSMWGKEEFENKLKPIDISLKEWLNAI